MNKKIWGLMLVLLTMVISCKSVAVENPKANIKDIVKSPDVTLIDVRTAEQYEKATVKNAINIPLAELEEKSESLKGKKVVVFCNKGIQADKAVEILKKNNIEVYDGTTKMNVQAILDEK